MKKVYSELKTTDTYQFIMESFRDEIHSNKISVDSRPNAEIMSTYRELILEYVESEGWTVSEFYCQGDPSGAHWGWTAKGEFPNYSGMNELCHEFGIAFDGR